MPANDNPDLDWLRVFEETANPSPGLTPEQRCAGELRAWFAERPDGGIEAFEQLLADAQKQRTRTKAANQDRQSTGLLAQVMVEYFWEKCAAEARTSSKKVLDKEIRSRVRDEIDKLMLSFRPDGPRTGKRHFISDRTVRRLKPV